VGKDGGCTLSVKQRTRDLVPIKLEADMLRWKAAARAWTPHPYQERALKFELAHPHGGLLLDPGLGKTSITLAEFCVLLKRKMMRRALVVAPLRAVYDVWPAELRDWTDFHDLGVALLHGPGKDKVLRQLEPCHQVCLINFDGLPWLFGSKARMKALGADVFVVDESSKLKDSSTVRFRSARKVLHQFKRRHILTGSPRPKSYLDLFGQIFILDRGEALGTYITHYRQAFFFPTGYDMREWELLPGADKEIDKLVAPMVLRLDAEDYLKLPKILERVHRVELPAAARKDYDAIEEKMMGTLFDAPMTTSAAARSKCAQIANGGVYLDAGPEDERWPTKERRVKFVHTAKVDALVDLYEELQGEPLLVGIGYHHDVAAIRKAIGKVNGKEIPCINGQTTRGQSSQYVEDWNRGKLPIMLVHPASAGHALNLQKFNARHVAFFYIPDDFDHFDQMYKRVRRQGNKAAFVMRHVFISADTVDVPKLANLRRKETGQKAFLDAMRKYAEERGYLVNSPKKPRRAK
jgi:hypothetical protein